MNLLLGTVMLSLAFTAGFDQTTNESPPRPAGEPPRVRTADAALAAVIRHALEVSPTIRRIVDAIQSTDGVVYVEQGHCGQPVRGCTGFGSVSGPNRVLRITIDPGRNGVDAGIIGHELQHALEVLRNPTVRSPEGMVLLYMRIGEKALINGRITETPAAIAAGNAVRSELRKAAREVNPPSKAKSPGVTALTASK